MINRLKQLGPGMFYGFIPKSLLHISITGNILMNAIAI